VDYETEAADATTKQWNARRDIQQPNAGKENKSSCTVVHLAVKIIERYKDWAPANER
jgi:hypothetical protein